MRGWRRVVGCISLPKYPNMSIKIPFYADKSCTYADKKTTNILIIKPIEKYAFMRIKVP
jgi:hypothetical protein